MAVEAVGGQLSRRYSERSASHKRESALDRGARPRPKVAPAADAYMIECEMPPVGGAMLAHNRGIGFGTVGKSHFKMVARQDISSQLRFAWKNLGAKAAPVRNQVMLNSRVDCVHAFPLPDGTGTQHMISIALQAGVPVVNRGFPGLRLSLIEVLQAARGVGRRRVHGVPTLPAPVGSQVGSTGRVQRPRCRWSPRWAPVRRGTYRPLPSPSVQPSCDNPAMVEVPETPGNDNDNGVLGALAFLTGTYDTEPTSATAS